MTDDTKFKLLAAFKHMDQIIDPSNFDARLVFQKQIYLLQELGLQLGNTYGWYIHGPYSSEAASDGFQLVSVQDRVKHLPELSKDDLQSLKTFEKLFSESKETFKRKDEAYILELLGSLHFLVKYGYPRPTDKKTALKRFFKLKPQFKEDAKVALGLLEKHGLV